MFCPECGNFQGNGVEFCSFCGAKISSQPIDNETNTYSEPLMPAINEEKKKKGKKKVKILISLLLVAAILTGGVFIVPGVVLKGNTIDNVFYLAAMDIGKEHENYPLMMVLAAAYNTVFNSKSYTIELKDIYGDDEDGRIKVRYGGKWYLSDIYAEFPESTKLLMHNGSVYTFSEETENGTEGDFENIFSSEKSVIGKYFELIVNSAIDNRLSDLNYRIENVEATQEEIDKWKEDIKVYEEFKKYTEQHISDTKDVDKAFSGIIKNRKINLKNIIEVLNFVCIEPLKKYYELNKNIEDEDEIVSSVINNNASTMDMIKLIIDLVAKTDYSKALKIKDSRNGSGRDAVTKYTVTGNLNAIINCLFEEVAESEEWKKILSEEAIDYIKALEFSEDEDFDFKLVAETKNSYISRLSLEQDDWKIFEIEISDVNKTEVTEEEIENFRKKFKKCENIDYAGEFEDIFPTE